MTPADADAGDAHAFVASLDEPELAAEDRHHLERVLRLRAGAPITVSDGVGRWRRCRFGATVEPDGPVETEAEPSPAIGVGFALVKGDRPELIVQKLTELGVDLIVPVLAERCVVRWDAARAARHHDRLVKVAREAAMQCRRSRLPTVAGLTPFAAAAALDGACIATQGGEPVTLARPIVLVGPEGGWSPAEATSGLVEVGLAPYVLRAETAAIVAGALLAGLRGRFI